MIILYFLPGHNDFLFHEEDYFKSHMKSLNYWMVYCLLWMVDSNRKDLVITLNLIELFLITSVTSTKSLLSQKIWIWFKKSYILRARDPFTGLGFHPRKIHFKCQTWCNEIHTYMRTITIWSSEKIQSIIWQISYDMFFLNYTTATHACLLYLNMYIDFCVAAFVYVTM